MNNKIKLIKISAFLLLASMLYFGNSTVMDVILSHNMNMDHSGRNQFMPCCDIEAPLSGMLHYSAIMTSNNYLLGFIGILVMSLFFLFLANKKRFDFKACNYIKKIRELYGGWRYFESFLNLFRLGILHPKTF